MMGWAMLMALAIGVGLLLWRSGYPRRLWSVAATALMLGAAGYAWQGNPTLGGHPVAAAARPGTLDPNLIALRNAMFGQFSFDTQYFVAADAMTRVGKPSVAAQALLGGVDKAPNQGSLWAWLGLTLAENDGNQVSPAAKYAFERGMALWPKHPGPPFLYGLALVREGKWEEARPLWAKSLALTPEKASYRPELQLRLFLLDQFLTARAAEARGVQAPTPPR
jgi:cytochrome c-type biogenesis protein CcmH